MDVIESVVTLIESNIDFLSGVGMGLSAGALLMTHKWRQSIEQHQETIMWAVTLGAHLEVCIEHLREHAPTATLNELQEQANRRAEERRIDLQTGNFDPDDVDVPVDEEA